MDKTDSIRLFHQSTYAHRLAGKRCNKLIMLFYISQLIMTDLREMLLQSQLTNLVLHTVCTCKTAAD